ncbi:MAG: [FeFe] hydrogenase H-cluster maturation GTPase HydF [Lachnospiraceae bacterium]
MSMNDTPRSERLHIALFGRRNAGKSSVINAMTNQELAIVSDVKGTTTDPVYKAMEILPIGPVVLIDTPGLDDTGELGELRVKKTMEVLRKTNVAMIILDGEEGLTRVEEELLEHLEKEKIPTILVLNKSDLLEKEKIEEINQKRKQEIPFIVISALKKIGIDELKEKLASYVMKEEREERVIVRDLIEPGDFVVLVVPIDKAAPKGRLILPQQQTIRDILDANAISIVVKETELRDTLKKLGTKPSMVITDSQAFEKVAKDTPDDIRLTSFSILFARYKGELEELVKGAKAIETLEDGDKILMSEGCTHHRQCGDIGTQKLPNWIRKYTKKDLIFETSSGAHFPEDLKQYKLIVHCGACMLNEKEMKSRIKMASQAGIPIVNYGVLIAYLKGILDRSLEPFDI